MAAKNRTEGGKKTRCNFGKKLEKVISTEKQGAQGRKYECWWMNLKKRAECMGGKVGYHVEEVLKGWVSCP